MKWAIAYYREIARGQIRGDTTGRLKLIFHRETRRSVGRPHHWRGGSGDFAHRPGGYDLEGHDRILRQYGIQLSDTGRML